MRQILVLAVFAVPLAAHAADYFVDDVDCDGFPRVMVETADGLCLGLVAQAGAGAPFIKPRDIVQIPDSERFLVTDMGGWAANAGTVWLVEVDESTGQLAAQALLRRVNLPHQIAFGPDGKTYVGEAHRIVRVVFSGLDVTSVESVVDGLPGASGHLHPLTEFVFDFAGNLLVNAGSSSDRCGAEAGQPFCRQAGEAGLRRYRYDEQANVWDSEYEMLATGLRNSMALVQHESGTLLQAENSADYDSQQEPYDEINVVVPGAFYGWPYCYNESAADPTWRHGCAFGDYHKPWTLLPPHSAPLGMLYYPVEGDLSVLSGKLVVTWHGHRETGNRIVAYEVDSLGRPVLGQDAHYWIDKGAGAGQVNRQPFAPRGGLTGVAQAIELTPGWNAVQERRPEGAPVGMTVADDGTLWIVDDLNRAVLRLAEGLSYKDGASPAPMRPAQ